MSATTQQAPTKVVTAEVRFSYAHVFTPTAIDENSEKKYSTSILIKKSDKETLAKINAAIEAAKQENAGKWGGKVPPNLRTPLRDGDIDKSDDPTYAGCFFMTASSKRKPTVVDASKQEIIDPSEFYSGCYGRASINFFGYAAAGNKGIGCGLNAIQKLRDGEALGGGGGNGANDFDDDDLLG